jgi:hypothetical protein
MDYYFEILHKLGLPETFNTSKDLLKYYDIKQIIHNGWVWLIDENDIGDEFEYYSIGIPLPIRLYNYSDKDSLEYLIHQYQELEGVKQCVNGFWGVPEKVSNTLLNKQDYKVDFLDYQILYDPNNFNNMRGKNWRKFRKNSKIYPRENPITRYTDRKPSQLELNYFLGGILEEYAEKYDQVFVDYFMEPKSANVRMKYMFTNNRLVGVNVWEVGTSHIYYRFCLSFRIHKYLDEFMRFCFYTDPEIQGLGMLVDDGGSVGSDSLFKFKQTLNPVAISKVEILHLNK